MGKRVKSALVIAKGANGQDVYIYGGAPLPDGLADGEAERLAEFLEDDEDEKPAAKKSASSK